MTERQLVLISPRYFGIKRKYLAWGVLIFPAIFFTIRVGLEIATLYPAIKTGLYLLTGVVAVSYIPLCQVIFAFVTGVYPSGYREDFVFANRDIINTLAIRGVILVFSFMSLAVILALYPGFS